MQTIYAIIIGVIASLIAWWTVNILLIPKFGVSDLLYNNENRPYLKFWNKSWHGLNVYDVKCYITYFLDPKRKLTHNREVPMKPFLTKGSEKRKFAIVKLDGDERLSDFFNDGNTLQITIVGQNRFGVKQVCQKEIIVENTTLDDDNC